MNSRFLIASLALIIGLLSAWLLIATPQVSEASKPEAKVVPRTNVLVAPDPQSDRKLTQASDRDEEFDPLAIPYERIISFSNEDDYRQFLKTLANSKLRNLGQINTLRAVRLGFDSPADFAGLGIDPDQLRYNYPVTIPEEQQIAPQSGLVGFGNSALEFMGVTTDNSEWGRGVKIAVIDTGIEPHLALSGKITHLNLIELEDGVTPNSHGTSVASLIAGTHPNMRGVAPGGDLISVRIADQNGETSSFLLAQGIIDAADAGAQLVAIALGSDRESLVVRQAIDYATERGSVIFASSGNKGADSASQPAADPRVFSVGAIDALGQSPNFSSRDNDLAIVAPGYQVRAAVLDDNVSPFTGTSASVGPAVGAVAAIMTQSDPPVSAQVATQIMIDHTNEAGRPGADPQYGNGMIDVGRAIQRNTPGIVDLATASQYFTFPNPDEPGSGGLQVSVENRGTEAIYNSTVNITIAGDLYPVDIRAIQPNERRVIDLPAGYGVLLREGELSVKSEVTLSDGSRDFKPANDQRDEIILLPENGP